MKYIILTITIVLSIKTVVAQKQNFVKVDLPVKLSLKEKKEKFAEIYTQEVSVYVEGYDGEDVSIEPYVLPSEDSLPVQAAGLNNATALTGKAVYRPNTASQVRDTPEFLQIFVGATGHKALLIKVPRNIHLKLSTTGYLQGNKISIKDFNGELEVGSSVALVEINNITGPLSLSSRYLGEAKIKIRDVKWSTSEKFKSRYALYISSYSAGIDIAVPDQLKATLSLHSNYGEVYSNLGIKPKFPESNSQNTIVSNMNGGGILIGVITEYGNIFLRKEK